MSDATHTEVYRGHRIQIFHDTDPMNPRTEYENLGTMICFHKKHNLGDKHDFKTPLDFILDITGVNENDIGENIVDELGDGSKCRIVWEPLYLYDHSGITMSTSPFSCRWDSGQVGVIYITYDKIMTELGITHTGEGKWEPSIEIVQKYETLLTAEVSTYDDYIRGNVYGFQVFAAATNDPDDVYEESDDEFWGSDEKDACWGFFGAYEADGGPLQAARESVDALVDC